MDMVDHTIVHFEIPAKDAKKLMKFYVDLFEWKMEKVQWMDYWLVETVPVDKQGRPLRPGINGGLYQKDKHSQNMTPVNYINVESVDEYVKKIEALGGKIIVPKQEIPDVGWSAIAVDLDGNYFGIFQGK
jgi:predicted enzyme related to lactoylglutathione lyase